MLYDIPTVSNADRIKVGARNRIRSAGSGTYGSDKYLIFCRCRSTCTTRTEGRFVEGVGEQYIFPRQSFASAASNGDLKVKFIGMRVHVHMREKLK